MLTGLMRLATSSAVTEHESQEVRCICHRAISRSVNSDSQDDRIQHVIGVLYRQSLHAIELQPFAICGPFGIRFTK